MDINDGFTRNIFVRRPGLLHRFNSRRIASAICIFVGIGGLGIYHYFDTVRAYERGIEVGQQECK